MVELSVQYFNMRLLLHERGPQEETRVPTTAYELKASVFDWFIASSRAGEPARKVLGYWRSSKHPREVDTPLMGLHLVGLTPAALASHDGRAMGQELRLRLKLLPLRAHLDAKIVAFFKEFFGISSATSPRRTPQPRTRGNESEPDTDSRSQNAELVAPVPLVVGSAPSSSDVFFQLCEVMPVKFKADYHPTSVDFTAMSNGDYMQVLNMFPLDGLELLLARVRLTGISGLAALFDGILQAWVQDVYAHQLHKVISGTVAFRSMSSIGASLSDLILIPLEEYKKHGRGGVMKGVKRGTASFLRILTRETLDMSQKFTRMLAQALSDVSSDAPSGSRGGRAGSSSASATSMALRQPVGVLESLERAYDSVSRELNVAMDTIVCVPLRQYSKTGPGGYMKSVVRAVPVAVLRPVVGATEAISYTLLGLRNRVDPQLRRDEEDMWNVSHNSK
jgi:autophagy-related protein 2